MHWQTLVAPVAGLLCVGLTFALGRVFFRRRSAPPSPERHSAPDPFEYGSPADRRSSPRRAGREIKVLISNEEAVAEPEQGYVINRSMGGLCLGFEYEIPQGTVLSVRLAQPTCDSPWLKVEVKHCVQQKDGSWELGCQFIGAPSWSLLLQFN